MESFRVYSAVEQVSVFLKKEIVRGTFSDVMPGVAQLSSALGVSPKTVVAALAKLEDEGILAGQGERRSRRIVSGLGPGPHPMRISILLYEPSDVRLPYIIELQHALSDAGHTVRYAGKSLTELRMELAGVRGLVKRSEVDAWIVVSGSQEVLEWFISQRAPAFALFGRRKDVAIAAVGPNTSLGMAQAARHLIELGHRRIVKICRRERRKPHPGPTEQALLDELSRNGIPTGDYNLPDWEETMMGLNDLLQSLFRVTPPTALIVGEPSLFLAVLQFLGSRGLRVPEDTSLVCTEIDQKFLWCKPSIAHFSWDSELVVRRVVKWASTVSRGKVDLRQVQVPSEFVDGGSVGPVAVSSSVS